MQTAIEASRPYHEWIDLVKGIGIILVIAGHGLFPYHYAIDVFHMPLFFFLAGVTFRQPHDLTNFILKKINRIGIPYLFFSLATGCIAQVWILCERGGEFLNGPLWFLQTLFTALVLYALLVRNLSREIVHGIVFMLSVICFLFARHPEYDVFPFHLIRACAALVFIHIGRSCDFEAKHAKAAIGIGLLCYVVGLYLLFVKYHPAGLFVTSQAYSYNYPLYYLTALGGIIATVAFGKTIGKIPPVNWLGRNSLIIVCVHFPLIERLNVLIAKTELYHSTIGKCLLAIVEYGIVLLFSAGCIVLCKKFIPKLTGYAEPLQTVRS